jgi:hypothetical protein
VNERHVGKSDESQNVEQAAPKCCSATINSPDDGYFAARDSNVGFMPVREFAARSQASHADRSNQ